MSTTDLYNVGRRLSGSSSKVSLRDEDMESLDFNINDISRASSPASISAKSEGHVYRSGTSNTDIFSTRPHPIQKLRRVSVFSFCECVCLCVCLSCVSVLFCYTSTKSWRGYIFTAVCLCVCVSVCLCVRISCEQNFS